MALVAVEWANLSENVYGKPKNVSIPAESQKRTPYKPPRPYIRIHAGLRLELAVTFNEGPKRHKKQFTYFACLANEAFMFIEVIDNSTQLIWYLYILDDCRSGKRQHWLCTGTPVHLRPCSVDSLDGRETDVPILGSMELRKSFVSINIFFLYFDIASAPKRLKKSTIQGINWAWPYACYVGEYVGELMQRPVVHKNMKKVNHAASLRSSRGH